MNYIIEDDTLLVTGRFNAVSSGLKGGWKDVDSIFNHTVSKDFDTYSPSEYLERIARKFSLMRYFGLLTSVPMDKLSIVRKGEVTAFVTAGLRKPNETIGTINTILVIDAYPSDGAMINGIITSTEAKTAALLEAGYRFTGTNTDATVIARTGGRYYEYAGPASVLGRRIWSAVKEGVFQSLSLW